MYSVTLGRWLQLDPLGYVDGLNPYQAMLSNPVAVVDPTGTEGVGHHIIPQELWKDLPDSEGKVVWDRLTTGALKGGHGWDEAHAAYNDAVKELFKNWVKEKKVNLKKLTGEQAKEFFGRVIGCDNPAIRKYLQLVRKQLKKGIAEAFEKALQEAETAIEKQGAKRLAEYGGKKIAQTVVKDALNKLPLLAAVFFLLDAKEEGWAYATRNAIVPADLINEVVAAQAARAQQWASEGRGNVQCNLARFVDPDQLTDDPLDDSLRRFLEDTRKQP